MRSKDEYYAQCGHSGGPTFPDVANWIYERVCRRDFSHPGFVLLNLPAVADSFQLRRLMVDLKQQLSEIHRANTGKSLAFMSLGRFDQQETTRPHRDGGPEESLLLLGYEPTPVRSRMFMLDDLQWAFDLGLEPSQLPPPHDPLETEFEPIARSYLTAVAGFDPSAFQLLVIDNSSQPYREDQNALLGVMHHAVIENRSASAQRIVNSIMLAPVGDSEAKQISAEEQQRFLTMDEISNGI